MSGRGVVKVVGILAMLGVLGAAVPFLLLPQLAYRSACQTDTPEAYQEFLERYPGGGLARRARLQWGEYDWERALGANTVEAFRGFTQAHPEDPHAAEAKIRIDEMLWEQADATGTVESLRSFLEACPDSPHAASARQRIETALWQRATEGGTVEAYEAFLTACPESDRAGEAREKAQAIAATMIRPLVARYRDLKRQRLSALNAAERPILRRDFERAVRELRRVEPINAALRRILRDLADGLKHDGAAVRRETIGALDEIVRGISDAWERPALKDYGYKQAVQGLAEADPDPDVRAQAAELAPRLP